MRPRGWAAAAAIVALAVLGWLIWSLFAIPPRLPALGDATPEQLAEGAKTYATHCAACHGANLEGQADWRSRNASGRLPAPPHDASGHTWHHPDDVLFAITKHGLKPPVAPEGYSSDMPAYAGVLGDAQIWTVLAFIASHWPERERQHQARVNERHRAAR
ncbi:MAG TPA: cytochrome c [Burkholderiaceae bacterium]